MKKITCFSDTHGKHRELSSWFEKNSGDILIYAGDYQKNSFDDGVDFLNWFASLPFSKKVLTFGNHDSNWEIVTHEARKFKSVIVLNQDYANVLGVKIFASPYSVKFGNWWFMKTEPELEELYAKIPNSTKVLVTHSPAFNTVDACSNGWLAGSKALADRINELPNLKYHVCGHIHEAYGMVKKNGLTYINAASMDELYHVVHEPFSFSVK